MGNSSHDYIPSTPTAQTEAEGNSNKTAVHYQKQANDEAWQKQMGANRPDIDTAYGQQQWTQNPDGTWGLNSGFNGTMGQANSSLQDQYAKMSATPMDNGTSARNQAIDSAYGQATSRMDPEWDKRQSAMQTQLLNQGLDPSSEASKSAAQSFGNQRNDAYGSAMNAAIAQGTSAGHTAFQDNLSARNAPLQQMQAMNSLLETPKYNAAGQPVTADYLQATRDTNEAGARAGEARDKQNQWAADSIMKQVSPLSGLLSK